MSGTAHDRPGGGVKYCEACGAAQSAPDRFCGRCGAAAPTSGYAAVPASAWRLPLTTVLPLRDWYLQRPWLRMWSLAFLVAATAPFLLLHLGGDPDRFTEVSWGFSLYFAFIWFIALYTLVRPEELPWPLLGKVAVFTVVAGVAIAIGLEERLARGHLGLVTFVLGVGLPEEFAKALAIYLFMYRAKRSYSIRTFLFVGAVSGLVFGASEAASYSTDYAEAAPFVDNAMIVTEVWRLVSDSLLHACMAGTVAFFIGVARHVCVSRTALIGFGLGLAALLHGLYDNFADSWVGAGLAVLIVFLFVCYVQTGDQVARQVVGSAGTNGRPPEQRWATQSPSGSLPSGDANGSEAASTG